MQRMWRTAIPFLALSSCAPQPGPLSLDSLKLQAVPAPSLIGGAGSEANAQVGTQIAGPQTYIPPMPTAVIILKDPQNDPSSITRSQTFCQNFVSQIKTVAAELNVATLAPNIIQTRWLVDISTATPAEMTDCGFLLSHYDYQRAGIIMGSIPLSGQTPVGKSKPVNWSDIGPFILEVFPDSHVAIADASGVGTAGFTNFTRGWLKLAVAQQEAIGGANSAAVASAASNSAAPNQTPSQATKAAADKSTSVGSTGFWKNVYQVALPLLELIPSFGPLVKIATTVVGDVCKVVGTGSS